MIGRHRRTAPVPIRHELLHGLLNLLVNRQTRVRLRGEGSSAMRHDFLDLADVVDRELPPELLGQILVDVLLVLTRQDHFGDAVRGARPALFP